MTDRISEDLGPQEIIDDLQAENKKLLIALESALGDLEYEVKHGEMPPWTRNRLKISRDRALRAVQIAKGIINE